MVSYDMSSGQFPLKQETPEQLSPSEQTESPPPHQGFNGVSPQWQSSSTLMQAQATGLAHMSLPHRHLPVSPCQSFPKPEHQAYREWDRDVPTEEFAHDRKKLKMEESVHRTSPQIHSQYSSPRGPPGTSRPTLSRDSAGPAPNYDSHHSGDGRSQSAGAPFDIPSPASLNQVDEPSPLGLTLRKTPSLLDLISMKLAQGGGIGDQGSTNPDSLAQKCLVPTLTAQDKLKASNFPASCLIIGNWERVSRYEGDLVGKCYYAKRKLVWEVLETGLKSKIEIQWSDISAMKASYPDNLPGTLEIEVSRAPLFFRETNPQPRKHTLWQACSDFTGGQATASKRHSLQFPEGVLNRHFEKLLQCDPRLKALVEGTESMKPTRDFEHSSWLYDGNHQNLPTISHQPIGQQSNPHDGNKNGFSFIHSFMAALPCNPAVSNVGIVPDNTDGRGTVLMKMPSNDLASPSSVMDPRGGDESGASDTEDLRLHEELGDYDGVDLRRYPNVARGGGLHDMPDVEPSCNNIFMMREDAQPPDRKILDEIAHVLLGEPVSFLSIEHSATLATSVRRMPDNFTEEFHPGQPPVSHGLLEVSRMYESSQRLYPFNLCHVKSEVTKGHNDPMDLMIASSGNRSFTRFPYNPVNVNSHFSKCDSAGDFLVNLSRVASFPQVFECAVPGGPTGYDLAAIRRPISQEQQNTCEAILGGKKLG